MTNAEISFVHACDEMGADVQVGRSSITVIKDEGRNTQQRKVVQGLTVEVAAKVAKAVVDNLAG